MITCGLQLLPILNLNRTNSQAKATIETIEYSVTEKKTAIDTNRHQNAGR